MDKYCPGKLKAGFDEIKKRPFGTIIEPKGSKAFQVLLVDFCWESYRVFENGELTITG